MGNPLQRALFAWRFRDVNLLISGQITPHEPHHDLPRHRPARAQAGAVPHVRSGPVPRGRARAGLRWIWDAYTTTNQYPYSQSLNLSEATDGQLPPQLVNYMRNSVKVVIDAYDGTMTYYANLSDPIIQVWDRAFPGLLTPIEDAPTDLQEHFRYPENIFQMQATQFANYHVTDAQVFYQKQDRWQIPADPTVGLTTTGTAPVEPIAPTTTSAARLRPYYLLMKVPGDTVEHFQLVLPFVPEGRQNMVAWMAANSDPRAGLRPDAGARVTRRREHRRAVGRCSRGSTRTRSSPRNAPCSVRAAPSPVRRLPGDPDERLVPVHPAGLRAIEPDDLGARAQARRGGER